MKLEQASYSVDSVIQLKESVHEYLKKNETEETSTVSSDRILGGVLSSVHYSWLACGPRLEVLDTRSGSKVAAWVFRAAHEFDTAVTCVAELPAQRGNTPLLVIGLECEITGGMICVFDIGSSRVIRAVQIDEKVTSVEVVSGGCDSGLPGVLRALDGVVAVGTAKGKVMLVDLCRQVCEEGITNSVYETIRDEINPCHLIHLEYDDLRNLESHKEMSLNKGDHLCLQLNEKCTSGLHFSLFGPSGDLRLRANLSEVAISSLYFSPSLCSLLIGYNFGCWCLYNLLSGPVLDYTSPMYDECLPVSGFAVQEPCDDPRAFLYVWVAYSGEQVEESAMVVMYALTYKSKDCLEGYGYLYQDLGNCFIRFQIEFPKLVQNNSARCVSLRSYNRQVNLEVPEERLTLCCIVWSCFDTATSVLQTYMSLFDLNQWYKEQMPSAPHSDTAPYMSCVNITQLLSVNSTNFQILDLRLDANSMSPFSSPLRLEEHYQPAALGLHGVALGPGQAAAVRSSGAQRHLLQQLEMAGPLSLLQPQELYHRAISLGLCPQYQDVVGAPTVKQMRWHIFSVALEQQLVRWLCRCVREWSTGAQSISGCTLDFLLEWAWQRASTLKFNCDKLCVPLFDHTGERLDHNALLQLNHAACQLKHLATLFETVMQVCRVCFSHQDLEDINFQHTSLQMLATYLEVLQWLLNVGLLPERPLSMYPLIDSSILSAPYPIETLSKFYQSRRSDLSEPLLFIDQLISRELGGEALARQWRSDGGDGNYPPPSLQSLLRTYLLEDVELVHKHCLFIYVFLDLAMILDEGRYKTTVTHLIKFPAVFKMGAGVIKVTQAMWQLDHGDFSTAMAQLLDPAVGTEDLKGWQHRLVLKALLLQGQHQHALLYHQVRKPPISSVQDICIVITLLIVNDLLQEAFHFQRQNRSVYNEKEILKHFFTVCDKMSQLQTILQLPLSSSEESAFISYLQQHSSDLHEHLQVIYYLQRDRYEEAFQVNDKLNANVAEYRQGLLGQQDRNLRNVVVQGFKKTLPDVTQTLLEAVKRDKERVKKWRNVERPIPMSVMVHDSKEQAKYKSTLIQASFHKAKETWTWLKDKENETPFISTPKTPLRDKRNEPTLIYASAMHLDVPSGGDGDYEATPAKRMKLSPRQPISAQNRAPRLSAGQSPHSLSLLDTPIVKRKSYRNQGLDNHESPVRSVVGTPTSILKVRSLLRKTSRSPDIGNGDGRGTSTTPEVLEEDMDQDSESGVTPLDQSTANAIKSAAINISPQHRRSSLGVSARRPIQRTPRPAVHFEDADRPSSRSSDGSTPEQPPTKTTHLQVRCEVHREQSPDTAPSSKDSSKSTEDVFYSPNESFNDEKMDVEEKEETKEDGREEKRNLKRKLNDGAVKSRRSYKSGTTVKIQVEKQIENAPVEEPSPRKEIFPKLGARRSLSRQVLELNTIRALQQPSIIQTRLSMAKPSSVEVSYSKTVTSFVKKSSDTSIEETCDKSTIEMKNIFTTEKDSSSTPIFKHVHNESSSKSSVHKLTEVLDEGNETKEENILSSSSDIDDSSVLQYWDKEKSLLSSTISSEAKPEEKEVSDASESTDDLMEEINKKLEQVRNKKVLNETVFEDISSIVEDEISSEESQVEIMETQSRDSFKSDETEKRKSIEKDEIAIQDEESRTSSESSEDKNIEEISQQTPEESIASEDNENKQTDDEEKENILVPSSEEDSDEAEKLSNPDEEIIFEEVEEEVEEEENEESAASSRSSDVIEIKSSSEEDSTEELKLNQTTEENHEKEDNLEQNIETLEEIVEKNAAPEETEKIEEMELSAENEETDAEVKQMEEKINQEITSSQPVELEQLQIASEIIEVEQQLEVQIEEEIEIPEDIQQEIEESMREEEQQQQQEKKSSPEIQAKQIYTCASQDCLEIMNLSENQPQLEVLEQTDMLCDENMAQIPEQIFQDEEKIEEYVPTQNITLGNIPAEPAPSYTPSRRSKRISSKQESNTIEEPTSSGIQTRRRSISIDVEEMKSPARNTRNRRSVSVDVEPKKIEETPRITRARSASVDIEEKLTRRRSTSVDVEAPTPRTRKRSTSVNVEEDKPRTPRRKRSTSVEIEEEIPKRSTRASSVISLPPIIEESRKTRASSQEPHPVSLPSRRGRKRSIQTEMIPEEPEEHSEEVKKALEVIPDKIEEYSSTHRLTRRQKLIMEKNLEQQELKKLESKHNLRKHVGKESPSGPQEAEEHPRSISPSSSVSSTPSRRGRRQGSSTPSTPRRSARTTRTLSRDTQDDVSSVRSVPVVKLDRIDIERHRSLSPTALKESPKGRKKNSRKSILPDKAELSKISEEASTAPALEAAPSTPKSRRQRGCSKKTTPEDSEQQPSQSTDSTSSVPVRKTATYRPLEEYAPKVSAFKIRKSFKVKKLTRSSKQ